MDTWSILCLSFFSLFISIFVFSLCSVFFNVVPIFSMQLCRKCCKIMIDTYFLHVENPATIENAFYLRKCNPERVSFPVPKNMR